MVTARPVERLWKGIGVKPDAVDLAREQVDRLNQTGVAAQPEQKLVKAEVTVKHREQVTGNHGRGVLPLQFLQTFDILRADRKWNDADRHHFQLFTNRIDFPHLERRQPAHHGAAVGDALDQALFLELEQRESHIAAVGLEQIAQILLDQTLPRLTSPQHDVLLDAPGDEDSRGRLARRWLGHRTGLGRWQIRPVEWLSGHSSPNGAGVRPTATGRPAVNSRRTHNKIENYIV